MRADGVDRGCEATFLELASLGTVAILAQGTHSGRCADDSADLSNIACWGDDLPTRGIASSDPTAGFRSIAAYSYVSTEPSAAPLSQLLPLLNTRPQTCKDLL